MTTQPTTSKRWRPRFSIRTLVVVVTLVCCYAACWGPTKTRGVKDVARRVDATFDKHLSEPVACFPLIVETKVDDPFLGYIDESELYYFWFFGYVAKLPYEREVPIQQRISQLQVTNAELREAIRIEQKKISQIRGNCFPHY